MKTIISFKHIDHTESLDEKIRQKSKKIEKYFEGNTEVHWTCTVKDGCHAADVKVIGPHFEYKATGRSDVMYKSLDVAIAKIEKQVKKKKEIWKDNLHDKHSDHYKGSEDPLEGYGDQYVAGMFRKIS